jgi:hypothetical protein
MNNIYTSLIVKTEAELISILHSIYKSEVPVVLQRRFRELNVTPCVFGDTILMRNEKHQILVEITPTNKIFIRDTLGRDTELLGKSIIPHIRKCKISNVLNKL